MAEIPEIHQANRYEAGVFFDAETGGPLELELGRVGPKLFKLRKQFGYRDRKYEDPFICPHDVGAFTTDLASIPFFFSWIVPSRGTHFPAIMLHDALVSDPDRREHLGPDVDREEADRIMRDAMERLGVGFVRRWLAWTGAFLATAADGLQPRWRWLTHVITHFGIIVILGIIATLDLFDVVDWLPWMGERSTGAELGGGLLMAIVIPPLLALLWGRRWLAPTIGGILLAFVFHITLGILVLYGAYRIGESLFAGRTRRDGDVAADNAALKLDDKTTAQMGKGSATFADMKLARSALQVSVTGPQMLVSQLRLVTDLGILEGHNHPALVDLARSLHARAFCGKRSPVDTVVEVKVDRQGPALHVDVGPMSMYESIVEIRLKEPDDPTRPNVLTSEGKAPQTLEDLLNATIASGTGRGYLAGLIPLAPQGHAEMEEAHGHDERQTAQVHGVEIADDDRAVKDPTGQELSHGHP